MKRYALALAALAMLTAGTATVANAVEFNVGPGGVYVGPHRDRHYDEYNAYNQYRGCRIVITRRTNRFGEDVMVRQRICD